MNTADKIRTPADADRWRRRQQGRVVFTNGVFDLLHVGHVTLLEAARREGDALAVGVNSDASVRRLKGPTRPIVAQDERAELIAALACVDLAVIFEDDTPLSLIEAVAPDVLVKGADWAEEAIVGGDFVRSRGGRVERIALREGLSTSAIVKRILEGRSALEPWT